MCAGQFSVIDPRCQMIYYRGQSCFWCGTYLHPDTWASKADMLKHGESCPMYGWAIDMPEEALTV